MTESAPNPPFTVQPPFDSDSMGDCILRTSDGTEFKVVKAILSLGSTVFRDMFDMPHGVVEDADKANPHIIPIEEDPETLQTLLQMLYPIEPPSINSLSLARKLVTACDKYFVNTSKLQLHIQRVLRKKESLAEDPLSCYVLSWKVGLEEEAITASRYIHSINISDDAVANDIVSRSGSLESLTRLWDLRHRQEKGLDKILALARFDRDMACHGHSHASGKLNGYSARKESLRKALMAPNPACENVETFLGFQAGQGPKDCTACKDRRALRLNENQMEVVEPLRHYPQEIQGFSAQGNLTK